MAPSIVIDTCTAHELNSMLAIRLKSTSPAVIATRQPNPSIQVTPCHQLKRVEAPVYAPGPGEVLLHIKATGICG
jgi:L-iditol 2-dehydrogenase